MLRTSRFIVGIITVCVLFSMTSLFVVNRASAVPACDRPFELKQPSGKAFEARQRGDEWYNWVETRDGYGIYKNAETGNWEYYVPADNGTDTAVGENVRSPLQGAHRPGRMQDAPKRAVVGEADPATMGIPKGVRPPKSQEKLRQDKRDGRDRGGMDKRSLSVLPATAGRAGNSSSLPAGQGNYPPLAGAQGVDGNFDGSASLDPSYTGWRESRLGEAERTQQQPMKTTAVSGTKYLLVIGVDYATTTATYKPSEVQALAFGASNSVADYYNDVSYSAVTIEPATESEGTANDGFIGWLRLSGSHPNPGSSVGDKNAQIAKDAILAADPYIDYSTYDTDGDGYVEPEELSIIVIVAGYEVSYDSSDSPSVWAHYCLGSSIASVDGKTIKEYAQFGERHGSHLATFGVIAHELGHLMFSLPDLYDTDYSSIGIGYFDLMGGGTWGAAYGENLGSSPTHLSAWSKEYLSWGTVNTISSSQTISLPKADSNKSSIFRINTQDSNQYFLMENRAFSGYDIGFQATTGSSGHGGLVIYHIDKLKTDNSNEYDKMVDIEEANEGSLGYRVLDSTYASAYTNIFFFSGNNDSFTDSTRPSSELKNGTPANISVTNISAYGDTMAALVDPEITPVVRPPKVETGLAMDITADSVILNGIINAYGLTTTVWFEYGAISGSYSSTTSTQTVSGTSDTSVSTYLNGLSLTGTTYYYRLVAQNSTGTMYGSENTITSLITVIPKLAVGDYHSLALKSDSTVWAWGKNDVWQLGKGTNTSSSIPMQVGGLSGVTSIAAGGWCYSTSYSLALKLDGTVWVWGKNNVGETDDGNSTSKGAPVQVAGLSNIIAIAGGYFHCLALKSDGTVWGWGSDYGQLGNGTYGYRKTPVQMKGLDKVITIATGGQHSLALKSDGTVWACGRNAGGQLGDGTTISRNIPVQVSDLNRIVAIAVGGWHSIALKSDGTVWAWGANESGQLGDGTTANKSTPVQVSSLSDITAIAIGGHGHSLALKSDGTVWAWGNNKYGQVGNGTTNTTYPYNQSTPAQVKNVNLGKTSVNSTGPSGSISINGGASYTNSTTVTLNLSAMDVYGVTGTIFLPVLQPRHPRIQAGRRYRQQSPTAGPPPIRSASGKERRPFTPGIKTPREMYRVP